MNEHRCYGCMQLHEGDFCPHCGWPAAKNNEVHQLPVGTVLPGQYEVGGGLGQGGFGITYLGWDRQLGAAVCIKEYFPSHAVSRDCTVSAQVRCHTEAGAESFRLSKGRFLREGRVLAQFREIPEIVSVYGSFEENDTVYIVMEYIKGMDLAHYVNHRGGRLSVEETFKILKPVMEALAQVHRSELVHRDIAPDNIMLHPRGGAKLLDFGAARMVENADVDKGLDRSTEAIVKHGFAPMEQYQTRGNLGPWTDVYAMCASIYYCLTGQIPPEATTRLMGEVSFSWESVPGLTDRQRQALEHGMAVLPKDRYRSMEELLEGLFGNAPMPMTYTEPIYAAPQPPAYVPQAPAYVPQTPAPAPKKRSKLLPALAGALAAVVLLVGGTLLALWARDALSPKRAPAQMEASAEMAPVETAAPMTEAPQTEAPEPEPMRFSVGVIVHDYTLEDLPQQLTEHLHASGVDAEVEAMYASNMMEVHDAALVTIASGFDALILQLSDTTDTHLVQILEQACAADIPTILVGYDPGYSAGTGPALENYPNVCYVGADPRELADSMSWMLLGCGDSPDKDNDDTIGYAFLGGTDGIWETHVIDWWLPNTMREWGYGCVQLGKYPDLTYPEEAIEHLEETLVYYYESLEAVFCTDADMVVGAVLTCEMAGVDMQNGIAIIGMGDTEEMEEYYAMGYLKGYVEYSREALVDQLTWVLLEAVRGETLEPYYPVGFEIHVAE